MAPRLPLNSPRLDSLAFHEHIMLRPFLLANKLIEDQYMLPLKDLLDWMSNLIEIFKAANLSIHAKTDTFRACTDGLWQVLFENRESHYQIFVIKLDDQKDGRLLGIVSWLLAIDMDLSRFATKIWTALDCCLSSGDNPVDRHDMKSSQ